MKVTMELVDKLAGLARLHFDEAEKEGVRADLEKMISFVDKLNELDTKGVEPLLHPGGEKPVFREDKPGGMVTAEMALQSAARKKDGFFVVPAVIKKSDP